MSLVVFLVAETVHKASQLITSCKHCNPTAEIPFNWIVDKMKRKAPSTTHYRFPCPAICPKCGSDIWENTPVEPM